MLDNMKVEKTQHLRKRRKRLWVITTTIEILINPMER
jgi:hypothetical protein